jgi:DNA-binding NtrC family response regulator
MQAYHWPGNVRELKNAIHRAFILADRELDLTAAMTASAPPEPAAPTCEEVGDCITLQVGSTLEEAQRRLICATLGHYHGNKTLAAAVLGVSLKTLYNRLKEYESKPDGAGYPGTSTHSKVA